MSIIVFKIVVYITMMQMLKCFKTSKFDNYFTLYHVATIHPI